MIKIGTRDSKLAVWQAEHVAKALQSTGYDTELIYIKTEGDQVLDTPLPLMGGKGVFTKALDDALLAGEIDIAVHSHKDIPTSLPDGLCISAVFEREDPRDVLVLRSNHSLFQQHSNIGTPEPHDHSTHSNMRMGRYINSSSKSPVLLDDETLPQYFDENDAVIATSSTRRAGQWLHRYPHHKLVDIRGNVQTRLRKLDEGNWDGAIFAAAGLLRLNLSARISGYLDWMISAPAQGAVAVMSRDNDEMVKSALKSHHHAETALCVAAERICLQKLEGGCSAPVGVYARTDSDKLHLFANVLSVDGSRSLDVSLEVRLSDAAAVASIGVQAAEKLLSAGAAELVNQSKH